MTFKNIFTQLRFILISINVNIIAKNKTYTAIARIYYMYKSKDFSVQLKIKFILHTIRTLCEIVLFYEQTIPKRGMRE